MKEKYNISESIDFKQIQLFVSDFKSTIEKKERNHRYDIKVFFDLNVDEETGEILTEESGKIDPVFLSYASLFLLEFPKSKITFVLNNILEENKKFSLSSQLEHFIDSFNLENRILLKGEYQLKNGDKKNIYLRKKIEHSQKFIPPIFIDSKETISKYFNKWKSNNHLEPIYKKYKDRILEIISEKGFFTKERNTKKETDFIKSLSIDKLSFIELVIYLLLINEDTYENLNEGKIEEKRERNKTRFKHYISYVKEISKGLRELADNIVEHSESNGVITARIFDKESLSLLKGENSPENEFLNLDFGSDFISPKVGNKQLFLDINVIDFGKQSISNKYISNLEDNIKDSKTIGINKDILQNDIDVISSEFKYKDFFIIGEKYFKLEHQQNKLISRYGLHHFTHIIKNELNGFIKSSSQGEGITIYNNKKRNEETPVFIENGTTYNCIIPLKIDFSKEKEKEKKEDEEETKSTQAINTFEDLDKYVIIDIDSQQSTPIDKKPIYKFPSKEHIENDIIKKLENEIKQKEKNQENTKYLFNFGIYNLIKKENKHNEECILLIDAEKLSISNESNWTKLLSAINNDFKNVIVYNTKLSILKKIKELRANLKPDIIKENDDESSPFYKQYKFWLNNSRVLFYSKKERKDENGNITNKRFGATLLTGETEKQFNIINSNIGHHHYNYGFNDGVLPKKVNAQIKLPVNLTSNSLFHNGKLKYFESIISNEDIKNKSKLTLFEESVQYSLNTLYRPNNKTNNKGYKIKDTHFRLGSKIHIEDFFYGKRLFQNSFFTTPLAYRLVDYITNQKGESLLKSSEKYSIIGYDRYSDFLVSTVRNLLEKRSPKNGIEFNHFTISKNGRLSRDEEVIHSKTIIIVPIASTFSTSLKIKKDIDRILTRVKKGKQEVVSFLNIVLVADEKSFQSSTSKIIITEQHSLSEFKWKEIDKKNKTIKVDSFDEDETIQKYFIPLFTNWHKAHSCEHCFPINQASERCLIETGSASITPQLIFGYPKTKHINEFAKTNNKDNRLDLRDSLLYGHLKKNNNSYLYFTKTGIIINKKDGDEYPNKNKIIEWLRILKNEIFDNYKNEKIVIVTPISGSKSNFLDLVNEYLFEFTANCLFISLEEDYIENAEFLYTDGLYKADKVIYVDDVLSTINSFLEVNYIVKYIRNKSKTGKGIDFCISLINRMSFDNENNMLLKLLPLANNEYSIIYKNNLELTSKIKQTKELQAKKVTNVDIVTLIDDNKKEIENLCNIKYVKADEMSLSNAKERLLYFTKINNPSIEEPNNVFPLKKEKDRYKLLSTISSLDTVRFRFNKKKSLLKKNDLSLKINDNVYDHKKKKRKYKKLNQLLILDAIYSLFKYEDEYEPNNKLNEIFKPEEGKTYDFNVLVGEINKQLKREIDEHKNNVLELYKANRRYTILKIICSTPLIYYKQIREASFEWINTELITISNELLKYNDESFVDFFQIKNESSYSKYQNLKFLLKRSVELKNNFIISPTFFKAIERLITFLKENPKFHEKSTLHSFNKLKSKFESVKIPEFKGEIYQVIDNNKNIIINDKNPNTYREYQEFINKIDSEDKDERDKLLKRSINMYTSDDNKKKIQEFKQSIKFKCQNEGCDEQDKITSKKLIYYLVSLVQELVLEHETKSIKLEQNINSIIDKRYKEYVDNTKNGNFLHYLRLLKLENTEVAYKFWEQIKEEKEKTDKNKPFNRYSLSEKAKNNPKYDMLINKLIYNKEEKIYQSFINVKTDLYDIEIHNKIGKPNGESEEKEVVNNRITNDIQKILENCNIILGDVKDSYLTVNYNKEKGNLTKNDLYVFKNEDNKNNNLLNDIEDSLTIEMFNLNKGNSNFHKSEISNFEVYKGGTDELPKYRDKVIIDKGNKEKVLEFSEIKLLKEKEYSILLVRISDFYKEVAKEEKEKLYTQAVLTFYLKKGKRIPEERLRLILLLRRSLSKYLKNEISTNTFLELLKFEKRIDLQKTLQHRFGDYLSNLSNAKNDIVNEIVNSIIEIIPEFKDKILSLKEDNLHNSDNEKIFKTVRTIIFDQIRAGDKNNKTILSKIKSITLSDLKSYLERLLKSRHIAKCCNDFEINEDSSSTIKIPTIVYTVIIPEIISNMITHSPNETDKGINIIIKQNELIFTNNSDPKPNTKKGLAMCKEIQVFCDDVFTLKFNEDNNDELTYIVNLVL